MIESSSTTKALDAALFEIQAAAVVAVKDRANEHLKSKYATLGAVWSACRDALHANRVLVTQCPVPSARGLALVTKLTHVPSGEWIASTLEMPVEKPTAHAIGSALTYARRYALAAMCNVVVEDDDAETAMGRGREMGAARRRPPAARDEAPPPPPAWLDRQAAPPAQPRKLTDEEYLRAKAVAEAATTEDQLRDVSRKVNGRLTEAQEKDFKGVYAHMKNRIAKRAREAAAPMVAEADAPPELD